MALVDYSEFELKPRKLSTEEIKNPVMGLDVLFDYEHLPQWRDSLWTLFKTTVLGDAYNNLELIERNNLLTFYEQLEKLVELAHIIKIQHANRT